jgi:quercetin dioxygenase-like cupin family protein
MAPLKPIVIPPGAGEIIGDSPDRRVEILSDCEELAATWSRFGPGRDGAGLHIHHEHSDLFYVLEGELTVRTGEDSSITATAGTLVLIPPMVVHGFRNASEDTDVKYLNMHTPGCGFADYMRGIRDKGDTQWFDQLDPEGIEGLRPADEIAVGLPCSTEAISVELVEAEAGAPSVVRAEAGVGAESFYVLEGDLEYELEGREGVAAPGTWLQVSTLAPSDLTFPADAGTRFLRVRTPGAAL